MIKRLKLRKAFCLVLIISSTNWATDLDSDIELPTTTEDPETRYPFLLNVKFVSISLFMEKLALNDSIRIQGPAPTGGGTWAKPGQRK